MEMSALHRPRCIWPLAAELGEGPVWSADEAALWFVDIKKCSLHRFDPATDTGRSWAAPAAPGFMVPCVGGGFIVGRKSGLNKFDVAGGVFTPLVDVEPD